MWIRDFHLKVFEPFVFSVLSIETVMDAWEIASIHTRCEFRSVPLIFEMIFVLGFVYWIERFETASDSHHSGFLWYRRRKWDGIRVLPGFLIRDSNRFFDSWFCSLPVSSFRSFLLLWSGSLWNPSLLLPSSSLMRLCDRVGVRRFLRWSWCWNCRGSWLGDEDSTLNPWELPQFHRITLEFGSGKN